MTLTPLPPPGRRGIEDHVTMSYRLLNQAREEHERGDRLQSSEKAWGAFVHILKAVAMQRGWNHDRHRHINAIGRQVLKEYDMEYHLDHTLPRANVMHFNFYENTVHNPVIGQSIGEVESLVIEIDDLVLKQPPQRFEVEDARDQERLRLLLGYDSEYQFPPGAYSNVGFSRNHADPDQEAFPANNRPPSYQPPGGV